MKTERKLRNLVISGIGSSGGGDFQTAKIDGVGRVEGDIRCEHFVLNGRLDVHGSLTAERADLKGTATVDGSVQVKRVELAGRFKIGGSASGESMEVDGSLLLQGNCEAETFTAAGRVTAELLSADRIHLTLHGPSVITELGGEQIVVRKQAGIDFAKWLQKLPLPVGNRLTAKVIEGDDINLECTTADIVRGATVRIGPGCEIGLVEYTAKLEQDPRAKVNRAEQITR
ncbi:polymer-forming cytoskeletal protein [Paenibacillus oryzisoli]|uniref:polymer-forming cytoskeletal protein n=1 Tax=Paenibacillus oryzisoli TaxID=1850517 RepID=UPI003D291538